MELGNYDGHQKRHGIMRQFDKAGHVLREMTWSHGKLDGTNRIFYGNGKVRCEVVCDQDRFVHGMCHREDGSVTYDGNDERAFSEAFGGPWNW